MSTHRKLEIPTMTRAKERSGRSCMDLPEIFPLSWPEFGPGASASGTGELALSTDQFLAGDGKNEDISGALIYGKTAGEAEIVDSLQTRLHCTDTTIKRNAETEKLENRAIGVSLSSVLHKTDCFFQVNINNRAEKKTDTLVPMCISVCVRVLLRKKELNECVHGPKYGSLTFSHAIFLVSSS